VTDSDGSTGKRQKRKFDHPEYKLQKKLGEGGMATVYLANQVKLDRPVALKIMSSRISQNDSFKKRFIREARTLAQFRHPNIITIYEVESFQDRWFIVMEYLDGGDLKSVMSRGLTKVNALQITRQICEALQYAHDRNYVHRDIKPENILFDQGGRLVLTDFGIARSMDSGETQLTQAGVSVGTPAYMAPEQFESSNVDHRADLYSLGVMLYQMLCGEKPFAADSAAAMLYKHATEAVPQLPDDVVEMQPLIECLMAKNVEDRPASASALIEWVDRLLGQVSQNPSHLHSAVSSMSVAEPEAVKETTNQVASGSVSAVESEGTRVLPAEFSSPSDKLSKTVLGKRYLLLAMLGLIVIAAPTWWLVSTTPAEKVTAGGASGKLIQSNPFDALPDAAPQDFYIGHNDAGEVVMEISSSESSLSAFAKLVRFDQRSDIDLSQRMNAWRYYQAHFAEQTRGDEILELALSRSDGWQEVAMYDKKIAAGENDAMNYYYRGYGYQMAGQYQLAVRDYNQALQMDPANEFVKMFRERSEELIAMEQNLLSRQSEE